ncbi:hypothetical protein ACU61A_27275 [Pseudonocardia sichuanensis]
MAKEPAKPADEALADLRNEWRTADTNTREEIEVVADKVQMIDRIMNGK